MICWYLCTPAAEEDLLSHPDRLKKTSERRALLFCTGAGVEDEWLGIMPDRIRRLPRSQSSGTQKTHVVEGNGVGLASYFGGSGFF
jgi:hypothetical protein